MAYLRLFDYSRSIQDVQLQQITTSIDGIRKIAELEAQAECISYLTQKYNTELEFTDTTTWDETKVYKGNDLVEINYAEYNSTVSYVAGNKVVFSGNGYLCTASTTGTFDPTKWTLLGAKFDLYFIALPFELFDYKKYYNAGDKVFWKDKVYACAIATQVITQQDAIQYNQLSNIPAPNVFPDDPLNGLQFWGVGTAFSVAAGTLPTDATKWSKGDNRSAQLVRKCIDICLYHLHDRISPKNIPQLRIDNYEAAISWLNMAKTGEITADIPLRQPKKDGRIRFGGDVRRISSY